MLQNEFEKDTKYRLFRSIEEILHPTISKKNISNYKIIIDPDRLPVRIFYPKKVTGINKAIIYVHGDGKVTGCSGEYSNICRNIALNTNRIVIAIEYVEEKKNFHKMYKDVYDTVLYLYKELEDCGILDCDISLIGDSTGCNIIMGINYLNHGDINILKEVFFYPVLSFDCLDNNHSNASFNFDLCEDLKEYFGRIAFSDDRGDALLNVYKKDVNLPSVLSFVGKGDILREEVYQFHKKNKMEDTYHEFEFSTHGFLKNMNNSEEMFDIINKFLV